MEMRERILIGLTILMVSVGATLKFKAKQCEDYATIDDYKRSSGYHEPDASKLGCDSELIEGWYRFTSAAGGKIPSSPPEGFQYCNTFFPIWLRGIHPDYGKSAHLEGCVLGGKNNCTKQYPIEVTNCSGFYVYKLKPTASGCSPPEGYCAGHNVKCKNGTRSIYGDGMEPCSVQFPNKPKNVTLSNPKQETNKVVFECSMVPDENQKFQVEHEFQFLAMNSSHTVELAILTTDGTTVQIYDSQWNDMKISLGKELVCRVRESYKDRNTNPILKNASYSEWVESDHVFVGINVEMENYSPLSAGKTSKLKLTFHITLPIVCNYYPLCKVLVFLGYQQQKNPALGCSAVDELASTRCNITISPGGPRSITKEIEIDVKASSRHSYESLYYLRIFTGEIGDPDIWHNYRITEIPLQIDHPNGHFKGATDCKSLNDPHMTTFDQRRYEHHVPGVYILYRNTELDYKVYIQIKKCYGGYPACNCLVAAEVEDDLLVIDSCTENRIYYGHTRGVKFRNRKVTLFQNGDLANGFNLKTDQDGRALKITLPIGTVVSVSDGRLFNVMITPSNLDKPRGGRFDVDYRTRTEGLCGVYDQDSINEPGDIKQWRITDTRFLNNGLPPKDTLRQYCVCTSKGTLSCTDACNVTSSLTTMRHSYSTDDVYPTDEDFQEDILDDDTGVEMFHSNRKWPTASGWTQQNATEFCTATINSTGAASASQGLPESVELDSYIQGCVQDIMLTDGTELLEDTLESLRTEVASVVERNISMWDTNEEGDPVAPPSEFSNQLCPRNCSGFGNCVNGTCECDAEHTGADCAMKRSTPPTLLFVPEKGLCDVRLRPCRATPIMGENFVDSSNLTCYVRELQIRQNGTNSLKEEVLVTKARFDSYQRIICPLYATDRPVRPNYTEIPIAQEIPAIGFRVEVSNDGNVKSDSIDMVSYDALCLNCTGFGSTNCSQNVEAEACLIDGRCYAHLQSHANDSCQICNATEDKNQWTRDYSKCMVGTECFSEGSYRNNDTYCWNCKPNINNSNLTLDNDHCLIDGMCFQQLESDPSNKCSVCNVTKDTKSWSMHNNMCLVGNECFENGDFKNGARCMNCKPESNNSYFTLDAGFCFIDGNCYENGKSKLGEMCEMCDVSINITRWTSITGCHKLPNQGLAPHVIGIIIGVGVLLFVAVIIVIVVSIKLKKQSKIDTVHISCDNSMSHTKPGEESEGNSLTTKGNADASL